MTQLMFQLLTKLRFPCQDISAGRRRDGPQQSANEGEINFGAQARLRRKERRFLSLYGGTLASWCAPGPIADGVNVILEGAVHYYLRRDYSRFYDTVWEKRAPARS